MPEGSEMHPKGDPTKRTPTPGEIKLIDENTPYNYKLTDAQYASELVKPQIKVANAQYNAQEVTNKVTSNNIDLGVKVFQGISGAPVMYGGASEGERGTVKEGIIKIYDNALKYGDKAVSTTMHEYNAHYIGEPLSPNILSITEEPNELFGQEIDPFKTATIKVLNIGNPSTVKEEIKGYTLEKVLSEKGLTNLKTEDAKKINENLQDHQKQLDTFNKKENNEEEKK